MIKNTEQVMSRGQVIDDNYYDVLAEKFADEMTAEETSPPKHRSTSIAEVGAGGHRTIFL